MDYNEMDDRPFLYTMSLIGGKWKLHILYWLSNVEVMRYSELKRALCRITHKMLSDQLKELEQDGLIFRKEYPQVPPKVEYGLTATGKSLMPLLHGLCDWGAEHLPNPSEVENHE